jgi:MFS family permease
MSSAPANTASPLKNFFQKFTVMRHAPRELWVVYSAYLLENLAYKAGSATVLTLWLSSDLGFGDRSAGAMVAVWSAVMTLITVFVGSLTDALGVRRTFLLGFSVCLVARSVMTLSVTRWVVLPFGLYLQAAGLALMIPVMACKKYSNTAQRSVAFSLYYALMNLGFLLGDWLFDRLRNAQTGLGEHGRWTLPLLHLDLSTYRVLILIGVAFTLPGLLLTWLGLRDGVEMTETGVIISAREKKPANPKPLAALAATVRDTAVTTGKIFAGLWQQPALYKFLLFVTLIVGVKMLFFHLSFTFPKYGVRELGEGAPITHASSMLNSLLIVVLVPVCGVLTQKISAYRVIVIGSFISALSAFFLVLPAGWFTPLARGWLGNFIGHWWLGGAGEVNPLYLAIFFFMVLLSIGEALWSPRLYEYAAAIAPQGQEASYMALTSLPLFGAKLVVGACSGWMLATYCPETGPRHPQTMWLIIGATALVTPLGAVVFRKFIQVREAGR